MPEQRRKWPDNAQEPIHEEASGLELAQSAW